MNNTSNTENLTVSQQTELPPTILNQTRQTVDQIIEYFYTDALYQADTTRDDIVDYFYDITAQITELLSDPKDNSSDSDAAIAHFLLNSTSFIVPFWDKVDYRDKEITTLHHMLHLLPQYNEEQKQQLRNYLVSLHHSWNKELKKLYKENTSRIQQIYHYMQNKIAA